MKLFNILQVLGPVEKLHVAVFYEVLCPDSKYFVRAKLVPAQKQLGDRITVQLVPYGKAEVGGGLVNKTVLKNT